MSSRDERVRDLAKTSNSRNSSDVAWSSQIASEKRLRAPLASKKQTADELEEIAVLDRSIEASQNSEASAFQETQPQRQPAGKIRDSDLEMTKGTNRVNDNIMVEVLRLLSQEDPSIHVCSPKFMTVILDEKLKGWESCKKLFRSTKREEEGTLRDRDLLLPSQDAPVLIMSIFTGSGPDDHWSTLIRDARGVGIKHAHWRYYDTLESDARAKQVLDIIKSTDLWKEGMTWEKVETPQQAGGRDDCGADLCAIAVSYVRWSSKTNHVCLNTKNLKISTITHLLKE